eukprot:COSAG01_NODE_14492_length_1446_cov_6.104677_2_plen_81_part_00
MRTYLSQVGDLGTLCQECLQIVQAAPRAAGNRQLLAAAASAAARAGPESALAVLAEAMRLATIPAAEVRWGIFGGRVQEA